MMLILQKGTTQRLILTLTEKTTLEAPVYYLFQFFNRGTREYVYFVIAAADDISQYPYRYNAFDVVVDVYFNNKTEGTWLYRIFQQDNPDNLDESLATSMVEEGLMRLKPANIHITATYTPSNDGSVKVYKG